MSGENQAPGPPVERRLQHVVCGFRAQRGNRVRAECLRELLPLRFSGREPLGSEGSARTRQIGAALADRLLEQALRQRRCHQRADRERSRRLAEDRDVVGIAAEGRDVLLHPLQRGDLIQQAVVARGVARRPPSSDPDARGTRRRRADSSCSRPPRPCVASFEPSWRGSDAEPAWNPPP